MGNSNSSIPALDELSKEKLAQHVAGIGDRYDNYTKSIIANGVDGELLSTMTENDFNETLDDLGVTSRLHRRKLLQLFRKAMGLPTPSDSTKRSTTSSTTSTTKTTRSSNYSSTCSTASSTDTDDSGDVLLPAHGPIKEVLTSHIEFRANDFPLPYELEATGQVRDSHLLPVYNEGLANQEQPRHLGPDFYKRIDNTVGGYRPPIPEDDMERVAQVKAYGLHEIKPDSEIAKTLTGFVETATNLFSFDFGDITFFDHESQFSFARVGLTDEIEDAIMGHVYTPLNYGQDNSSFLCKTDRSIGICNYPSLTKRTFVVHDLHADETFKWMNGVWPFRAYVGCPLLSPSGLVLGTLCLHNLQPRPDFSKAHEVQLEQVAKMAAQAIENWSLRRHIESLQQARIQVRTTNTRILTPPENKAALVLTDVQGSTELWEADPIAMKQALDLHDGIIRKLCANHNGYEVDTEGDSFLLAFHDAVDAFEFSLNLQQELYDAPWSKDILALPQALDDRNRFRGLRVRLGVHMGSVTVRRNSVTARTEYSGTTLDMTRAIESMAHGGQILTTFETWNVASVLAETKLQSPQVMDLGKHIIQQGKNTHEGVISTRILQLVPATLAVNYSNLGETDGVPGKSPSDIIIGRHFPEIKSLKKLSKSFADAPGGHSDEKKEVTIAFIGTSEIETRYKESAGIVAQVIGHASSILSGTEGYQCQNNMLAFPDITEAVQFGLRLMELLDEQKPMEDGAVLSQLVTFGCVHDSFVVLEPHKTTGRADYFGRVVNRAARVAFASKLGTVCVGVSSEQASASDTLQVDDPTVHVRLVALRQLKGVDEEMAIFECTRKPSSGGEKGPIRQMLDAVIQQFD